MAQSWKVIAAFVAVFIAGAVFGGFFTLRTSGRRIVTSPPVATTPTPAKTTAPRAQAVAPVLMRQFTQRLKLTAEQREKIRPLVGRAAEDIQRTNRENIQNATRIMERMHTDIAAWLTPEQRTELNEMARTMQERSRKNLEKRGEPALLPREMENRAARPNSQRHKNQSDATESSKAREPIKGK